MEWNCSVSKYSELGSTEFCDLGSGKSYRSDLTKVQARDYLA